MAEGIWRQAARSAKSRILARGRLARLLERQLPPPPICEGRGPLSIVVRGGQRAYFVLRGPRQRKTEIRATAIELHRRRRTSHRRAACSRKEQSAHDLDALFRSAALCQLPRLAAAGTLQARLPRFSEGTSKEQSWPRCAAGTHA